MSPSETDYVAGKGESPRWWLATRNGRAVNLFLIVVCTALGLHFLSEFKEWTWRSAEGALGTVHRDWWLSHTFVGGSFLISAMLCMAIGAGRRPRVCAVALFVVSVACAHIVPPGRTFDGQVAALFVFFLMLLPAQGATRRHSSPVRKEHLGRVSAAAVTVFLVYVCLLYVQMGRHHHGYIALALQAVPVLYVLPGRIWTTLGVGTQLAAHVYLVHSGAGAFGSVCLCSTAILFWGETTVDEGEWVLDGGAAVAAAFVVASVLSFAVVEQTGQGGRVARLVEISGMSPYAW